MSAPVNRWFILVLVCVAQFMVVLDATIVNVALPSIQVSLDFSRAEPAVGRQRLHARLRRLPPARRARRRPLRPAAAVHGRCRALHARLARERDRHLVRDADRRSRGAGPRRRARLAGRALDRHDDVRRGPRADEGARRLERDRRRWRRGRADPRRRAHRRPLLALGLLRQPADRDRGVPARRRATSRTRRPRTGRRRSMRPAP